MLLLLLICSCYVLAYHQQTGVWEHSKTMLSLLVCILSCCSNIFCDWMLHLNLVWDELQCIMPPSKTHSLWRCRQSCQTTQKGRKLQTEVKNTNFSKLLLTWMQLFAEADGWNCWPTRERWGRCCRNGWRDEKENGIKEGSSIFFSQANWSKRPLREKKAKHPCIYIWRGDCV